MASLQNSSSIHRTFFLNSSSSQLGLQKLGYVPYCRRGVSFLVRAEQSTSSRQDPQSEYLYYYPDYSEIYIQARSKAMRDRLGRRHAIALGAVSTWLSLINPTKASFAAEAKKGFLPVSDNKDGYEFLYPFGWQEVVIEGQDKVYKDVIEPLENVSVNLIPTSKQDIRNLGSPQEVAEILIKKVLAPSTQKTKLVEAAEHEVDGRAYYTFEFVAQAPNYTRHALGAICIGNGKFYTLTTGANERRWEKMKDKLRTVVDSFKIFNV